MKMDYKQSIMQLRESFNSGRTRDIKFRKQQLRQLKKMYVENKDRFCQALNDDLHKPKQESHLLEINVLLDDIEYQLNHLDEWAKHTNAPGSIVTLFDKPRIYNDPYGVVLVLGAWNYPLQLPLLPVSGAIAAGNCVVIKPSEISPATASIIDTLIPKYLDDACYKVICGGIPETTELLKHKFDYIFYTGSTHVGKIVRDAANVHLTPTTLELGGKSPTYIDSTVDMYLAAKRILWGKCINSGQTCVAPDYLICTKEVRDQFISVAKKILPEWYGDDLQRSPDFCRMISDRHFNRVKEFLNDGKVAVGGKFDAEDKYIEPTILIDVPLDSKVMSEEIFGPVLPIITVESVNDAIKLINSRDKPLAFYLFTNDESTLDTLMEEVYFGGGTVNDTMFHLGVPELPFGGVGTSGMGAYHGKASFETFTHKKAVLIRNYNPIAEKIGEKRYPPYSQNKISFLSSMLKNRKLPSLKWAYYATAFALGALSFYAIQQISKATHSDD